MRLHGARGVPDVTGEIEQDGAPFGLQIVIGVSQMSAARRMLSLTLYKSAGYALLSTDDRNGREVEERLRPQARGEANRRDAEWRMDGAEV
jgi:hypothetical protein